MNYNMIGLNKYRDGTYRDVYGLIVGNKLGLTKDAWLYLNRKYGLTWANNVSNNMKHGYIYENGKWRLDNSSIGNKFRNLTGLNGILLNDESTITDPNKRKLYINFLNNKKLIVKNAAKKAAEESGTNYVDPDDDYSVMGLLHKAGLSKGGSALAGLGIYSVPILGNVASAWDAIQNIRQGLYLEAAGNALFALPGVGNLARLGKVGKMALKAVNTGAKGKIYRTLSGTPGSLVGIGLFGHEIPGLIYQAGSDLKDTYNNVRYIKPTISRARLNFKVGNADAVNLANNISNNNSFFGNLKDAIKLTRSGGTNAAEEAAQIIRSLLYEY